jgi:hypothetical protein
LANSGNCEEASDAVDFWLTLAFSVLLLLAAAGLIGSHVRTWRQVQDLAPGAEPRETEFRWRQFRRRMQSSAMLAILAVAMLVGHWVTLDAAGAVVFSVYWGCVVLVVFWLMLLALADVVSTRQHFGRLHAGQVVEKARLEAEMRKILAARDNEEHPGSPKK